MPRANTAHRIEDVRFRQLLIRCICGWFSRGAPVEEAWLGHRREHGLTQKA